MSAKLRLVKVAVQPVVLLDDGENMVELEHPATMIPASEWPTYSSERFPREFAEWQAKLDAASEPPPPNRAARRAKTKATTAAERVLSSSSSAPAIKPPNRAARRAKAKPKRAAKP
jgi:hypothetical protein